MQDIFSCAHKVDTICISQRSHGYVPVRKFAMELENDPTQSQPLN